MARPLSRCAASHMCLPLPQRRTCHQVEAVGVHYLGPGCHEVVHEPLLAIVLNGSRSNRAHARRCRTKAMAKAPLRAAVPPWSWRPSPTVCRARGCLRSCEQRAKRLMQYAAKRITAASPTRPTPPLEVFAPQPKRHASQWGSARSAHCAWWREPNQSKGQRPTSKRATQAADRPPS